jgi:hypothetical protein
MAWSSSDTDKDGLINSLELPDIDEEFTDYRFELETRAFSSPTLLFGV